METRTIEQVVEFSASCAQIYDTLMDPVKHQSLSGETAFISSEAGGAFTVWGPHISGFNLVLKPGEKIVQAWRTSDWPPDHYSIATFDLRTIARGCELRFTQIGVPADQYDSISNGWMTFYWTPIREFLGDGRLSEETLASIRIAREYIRSGGA